MAGTSAKKHRALLREIALGYPGAHEDFPWGESVIKVKGKVFVFLGREGKDLGLSVKLPVSSGFALSLPFASPTGYGLARGGWVTAKFGAREKPPMDVLRAWLDESYRAVAPKKLVASLANAGPKDTLPTAAAATRRRGPAARRDSKRRG
jgi:predicted DNA-binding protein (MmcQ/YjbR family)